MSEPNCQFKLNLPKDLREQIEKIAEAEMRSTTTQIIWILREYVRNRHE